MIYKNQQHYTGNAYCKYYVMHLINAPSVFFLSKNLINKIKNLTLRGMSKKCLQRINKTTNQSNSELRLL